MSAAALSGRTILVTGASHGIGRAVVAACAGAGATVVACGRDVAALEQLADEVGAAGHAQPVLLPINLERAGADDFAEVAALLESDCGGLDGLVLNAARLGDLAPLGHIDGLDWARTFQVNLHSSFLLLQACLPLLRNSKAAAVLFTLAAEGLAAKANWSGYAVSKYALRGLFDLCTAEFAGAGIRVHAVVPPPSATALRRQAFPAADSEGLAAPAEVAATYLELLIQPGAAAHGAIIGIPAAD